MTNSATSLRSLIAYAGPAIPLALLGMPLIVYVPPFYAQELGLDMAAVGGIFFLARAWDAITDPVIGNLSDRTSGRWGRRKPWLVAGMPLLMIAVYCFLAPPPGISRTYLTITAIAFYLAWTIVQIPYLSWGAELSRDYAERTRITGIREAGSMIGIILATSLPVLYFNVYLGNPNPSLRETLFVLVVALGVLIPLTTLICAVVTPSAAWVPTERHGLMQALSLLSRNKPFMRLMAGVFFLWLGGSVFNTVVVFMVQQLLELPMSAFFNFVLLQYVLGIAFLPLWVKFANHAGRHRALVFGGFGFLCAQMLFLLVEPGAFWQALAVYLIIGPISAVIWVMPPALVADTIEYGMMKGGGDEAALYMAVYNLIVKVAFAGGVGIAMPLLGAMGFNPMGANEPQALDALRFVALILPALIGLPGALLLFNYPINRHRHAVIRRWLARRDLTPAGQDEIGRSS